MANNNEENSNKEQSKVIQAILICLPAILVLMALIGVYKYAEYKKPPVQEEKEVIVEEQVTPIKEPKEVEAIKTENSKEDQLVEEVVDLTGKSPEEVAEFFANAREENRNKLRGSQYLGMDPVISGIEEPYTIANQYEEGDFPSNAFSLQGTWKLVINREVMSDFVFIVEDNGYLTNIDRELLKGNNLPAGETTPEVKPYIYGYLGYTGIENILDEDLDSKGALVMDDGTILNYTLRTPLHGRPYELELGPNISLIL